MTIWKFDLEITDEQDVVMPKGSVFLHAAQQHPSHENQTIQIWMLVDSDMIEAPKRFYVIGTGHRMWGLRQDRIQHLASCLTYDRNLVWHIFEEKE